MTTFTDTWTDSDGASWPPHWTTSSSSAVVDIQNNEGAVTDSGGFGAWARLTRSVPQTADVDWLIDIRQAGGGAENLMVIISHEDGTWAHSPLSNISPFRGYAFRIRAWSDEWEFMTLYRCSGGTVTTEGTIGGISFAASAKRRLRVTRSGGNITVTQWDPSGAEPGTPQIDYTDGSPLPSGLLSLGASRATGTNSIRFDDSTIDDQSAGLVTVNAVIADADADAFAPSVDVQQDAFVSLAVADADADTFAPTVTTERAVTVVPPPADANAMMLSPTVHEGEIEIDVDLNVSIGPTRVSKTASATRIRELVTAGATRENHQAGETRRNIVIGGTRNERGK